MTHSARIASPSPAPSLAQSPAPSPDWSRTALGEQATWPAGLRTAVDIMLNSPQAMLLMWGPQQLMIYNDAYAALIGLASLRAPGVSVPALQPAAWSWNSSAIRRAWEGHSASFAGQHLPVWRNGGMVQQRLDLYYTPVRADGADVGGILCTLAPGAAPQPSSATQALQLLVVEDNADARYLVCETLRALGHEVHAVASGEEALPELARRRFDILFTDVSLPGMSGVELARLARSQAPGVGLLFASGYGDELTRHLDFPALSLQKPYDIEQLQAALEQLAERA